MSDVGVLSTGFVAKTQETALTELSADTTSNIHPTLNTSPTGPMGQLLGIVAQKVAKAWELLNVAYTAFDPDQAEYYLLDAVCAITGTIRNPATKSLIRDVTVNLDASTTLPAGSVANVVDQPTIRFVSTEDVTNGATGAADVTVDFECEVTGPVPCYADTLTVITAAVGGWNSVTNDTDAVPGRNQETDTELRVRRTAELSRPGACTVDAIRADLLEIDGVLQAFVFENTTNTTNGDGLPAHSIECVVFDGPTPAADDDDIVAVVWGSKAGGIQTYGQDSGTIVDALGNTQTVYFSRATVKPTYLEIDITIDSDTFPEDGDAQVKQAIKDKGDAILLLGTDVVSLFYKSAAISVVGVTDAPTLRLGFTASPVGTANLTVGGREIAELDTTRIVVTHV